MKSVFAAVAVGSVLALVRPAVAQSQAAVCSMFTRTAQGVSNPGQSVYVRPGVTALNFAPSGETIQHLEVSNPEKVSINFDADIDSGTATMVFLRPLTGITIENLPSAPTTQLMVTTVTPGGERKLYPFTLVYSPNGKNCNIWSVHAETPGLPLIELPDRRRVKVEFVTMGLEMAARDGSMPYGNELRQRVKNFVGMVRNGETVVNSAAAAGISVSAIQELARKGYEAYRAGELSPSPVSANPDSEYGFAFPDPPAAN